jgi:hypothetical protein
VSLVDRYRVHAPWDEELGGCTAWTLVEPGSRPRWVAKKLTSHELVKRSRVPLEGVDVEREWRIRATSTPPSQGLPDSRLKLTVDAPTEEAFFNDGARATVTCQDGERSGTLKIPSVNHVEFLWLGQLSQHYLMRMVADDASGEVGPDVYHQLRRGCDEPPLSEVQPQWGPNGFFVFPCERAGRPGWAVWSLSREVGFLVGETAPSFEAGRPTRSIRR